MMSAEVAPDRVAAGATVRDGLLVEQAARGNAEAFDALLAPRLDRLFRMAVAITRSEADAHDAVQEACLLAWRQLPRLRELARFDAWLAQILVNACRGLLRRRRRVSGREVEIDMTEAVHLADSAPSGTERLGEAEVIQHAFARLDPTARSLLVLHYVDGRPLGEIAAALGAPLGTIKWRLWRARRALDRALEKERR